MVGLVSFPLVAIPLYLIFGRSKFQGYVKARRAGVDVRSFHTTRARRNRFQLNFRNHRKIVVVGGRRGPLRQWSRARRRA